MKIKLTDIEARQIMVVLTDHKEGELRRLAIVGEAARMATRAQDAKLTAEAIEQIRRIHKIDRAIEVLNKARIARTSKNAKRTLRKLHASEK
jgi:phenylacetate-coenzyme A ligase PaaK-like adenylate-forming protein